MIYILSWTTKKHQKTLSRPLHSKLKKIQGLFKDLHRNLRTFQGLPLKFKDFLRLCEPCLKQSELEFSWGLYCLVELFFFTMIIMLGQYDSIRSLLSDGSPSQFGSDRDFVNISDIADMTFLFRGIQGKSGIVFQLRFHHTI